MASLLFFSFLYTSCLSEASPAQIHTPLAGRSIIPQLNTSRSITPSGVNLVPVISSSTSSSPAPSCRVNCHVHLPQVTVYDWHSFQVTATITVATVVKVINPRYYPNVTATRTLVGESAEGIPSVDQGGLYKTLHLSGPSGNVTKRLYYPTTYEQYGTAYWWEGVMATTTTGHSACITESAMTVQFQAKDVPTTTEITPPGIRSKVNLTDINWRVVEQVRAVDPAEYRSMFPLEGALASCQAVPEPATTTVASGPLYGATYVTATSTSTRTVDCHPAVGCNVHRETTATSLVGPKKSHGVGVMSVHSEITAVSLAGPHQTGNPVPEIPAMPQVQPATTNMPAVTGNLDIGPSKVHISIYTPPMTGNPLVAPLVAVDGTSLAAIGQTLTLYNTPVVITTNAAGLVAVLSPGAPNEHSTVLQPFSGDALVGAAPFPASHLPARHFVPITVGGDVFEPLNEHMFLMPDGQELSLGGPAVTLGDGGASRTVLSLVTGAGGSEVLVLDGVSQTLGPGVMFASSTPTAAAGGHGGGGAAGESAAGGAVGGGGGSRSGRPVTGTRPASGASLSGAGWGWWGLVSAVLSWCLVIGGL